MDAREEPTVTGPTVLPYGTHDRAGPWWRRWLGAWLRAAKPALVAAAIAAALAYALAPRQYTAVATVDVELDPVSVMRGTQTSPAMDFARADILARSLRQTNRINAVLQSSEWQSARLRNPGKTLIDPIEAEAVAGTRTVRLRFIDPNREMARIGVEAVIASVSDRGAGNPMGSAAVLEQQMASFLEREQDLRKKLGALREGSAPVERPTTQAAFGPLTNLSPREREAVMLERQLTSMTRMVQSLERRLGSIPRVQVASPPQTPRFPSNPKEMFTWSACGAGVAFPLVFLAALYRQWRYGRAWTVQDAPGRVVSVTDLATVLGGWRRGAWRMAARRAVGPALAAGLLVGAAAAWFTPWRYTATVSLTPATAPVVPTTAPADVAPAEVHAAFAGAAMTPQVLDNVLRTPKWAAVRGPGARDGEPPPRVDAVADAQGVIIRFTDGDRDAARYGAETAATAARGALSIMSADVQRLMMMEQRAAMEERRAEFARVRVATTTTQPVMPPRPFDIAASTKTAELRRHYAIRAATTPARFPASPAVSPWWPSNYAALARAGGVTAAQALVVVFALALLWLRLRTALAEGDDSPDGPRLAPIAWRPVFRPAIAVAAVVGALGYALAPRTYTSTATVVIRGPTTAPSPSATAPSTSTTSPAVAPLPPSVQFLAKISAELNRGMSAASATLDPTSAEIVVTGTATDPARARFAADSAAAVTVHRWAQPHLNRELESAYTRRQRDAMWNARLGSLAAPPTELMFSNRQIEMLLGQGAGHRLEVTRPATVPSWADQRVPIGVGTIAAVSSFAIMLLGGGLYCTARTRGSADAHEQRDDEPVPAAG